MSQDSAPHVTDWARFTRATTTLTSGKLVLNFDDSCGEHFSHGYWPAVRLSSDGTVADVTVEA